MSFRCAIWAAVSSAPQAEERKGSIPSQIANAQALIERRGWTEVVPPLVVPGLSRSIDWIHEAIAEIPAMAELIEIAKTDQIDLLICRDYDRLARTRTLLAQLSTYLSRCMIQIYAMDKPVEPIPVDELRRQRGLFSSATVEAFAGLAAEQEVAKIVERHYFGMNNLMQRGIWRHSTVAYGYTRTDVQNGHTITLDVPKVVPEEANVVRRIENMFLTEGMGSPGIARQLTLEGVPAPGNGKRHSERWHSSTVNRILINPWYTGYIVWGIRRKQQVYDPNQKKFVSKAVYAPVYQELKDALGHKLTVPELLAHQEELAADGVVIVQGEHEPLRTEDQQRYIDEELQFRSRFRKGASTKNRCYLFTGLIRCGECGNTFITKYNRHEDKRYHRTYEYIYYTCRSHRLGQPCNNRTHIREKVVLQEVQQIIQTLSNDPGLIEEYLEEIEVGNLAAIVKEVEGLNEGFNNLRARRKRWDDAYEAGALPLDEYGVRVGLIREEQAEIESRIAILEQQRSQIAGRADRRDIIREAIANPPNPKNRRKAKLYFRHIFEEIIVQDGKIQSVTLKA